MQHRDADSGSHGVRSVRDERKARGLSQYGLAVKTGLHPATISLAERGVMTRATTEKIAAALGLLPAELKP